MRTVEIVSDSGGYNIRTDRGEALASITADVRLQHAVRMLDVMDAAIRTARRDAKAGRSARVFRAVPENDPDANRRFRLTDDRGAHLGSVTPYMGPNFPSTPGKDAVQTMLALAQAAYNSERKHQSIG